MQLCSRNYIEGQLLPDAPQKAVGVAMTTVSAEGGPIIEQ